MKGLNIKDKDSLKEYLTHSLYHQNTSYCPSYTRSLISSKKNIKSKSNKSITINIVSHLNNKNSFKLSESSPIKRINSSKNEKSKNNEQNSIKLNLIKFPEIKEFNLYYEIPFIGKYDFIFLLRGNLDKTEWTSKTLKLRSYPRHLKNTLFFQNDTKIQQIHKYDFNKIYQIFLKIKNAGLNLYKNKKYRECLEQFSFAYGLFKWIEFKDKSIKLNEIINNENFAILDSDIEEKIILYNTNDNNLNNIYKISIIYILELIAYCNIELRLFSNAVECLEECAKFGENNFPDIYLRLAQARIYNKKSSDEELLLAEKDINKGINLVILKNNQNKNQNKNLIDINIYYKTKNKLKQIIKQRVETKVKYITALLKQNLQLKNDAYNNKNINEKNNNVLYIKMNDNNRQYKILKEIKKKYVLAFKFFTETKNYTQLNLTYKEYESFYDLYQKFKFFYKFSPEKVDAALTPNLKPTQKKFLLDAKNKKLIEKNKMNICEYIFMNGNYNNELYKYVVDKIFEEEKNKNENDTKLNEIKKDINYSKRKCFVIKSSISLVVLILISIWLQIYYLKSIRKAGFKSVYK